VYAERKDNERALADFDQTIRLAPQHPFAYYNRGNAYLMARKDYASTIADFKDAIRVNPSFTYPYFALAHVLASCPLANLREGKQAVEYAKKGCELSRWQVPGGWVALAVASAETGDFKEAIKWQKKALESAEQFPQEQQEEMRLQLKLFEQGKPYRQK
jgi:tetratricopeptide (TPR) repeat protein